VNGLPNRNVRPSGSPRSTCGKPFRNAANAYAPQAAILFDTFHVIRHLGEALDKGARVSMRACRERTDASSRPEIHAAVAQENLTLEGALRTLLRANKRLNTAHLLTESF
jgi:transposase